MKNTEYFINRLMNFYQSRECKNNFNDEYIISEESYFNLLKKKYLWSKLNDYEKQTVRKDKLEMLLRKLYKDSNELFIDYEYSVIHLYDSIILFFEKVDNIVNPDILLFRAISVFLVEKDFINFYENISQVRHIEKNVVDNIFYLMKQSIWYDTLDMYELENRFNNMYRLFPNQSYKI